MERANLTFAKQKRRFTRNLLRWYRGHARTLPWRRTRDPYRILVSELMLQQTQVARVLPYYRAWLKQFPTVRVLAQAPHSAVVAAWQGLGYNRRALFLHRAAKVIVDQHDGRWPQTAAELQALPGVGPYTAAAVASFAFAEEAAILDTNVKRLIGRVFLGFRHLSQVSEADFWKLSRRLLPGQPSVYAYNQALMDFGATICTARAPQCGRCPLQTQCRSYPAITTATAAQLRFQPKTAEPLFFGQPRRIWRGKILRALHTQENGSATLRELGRAVQPDFTADRLGWLQTVVDRLVVDGFVEQRGTRVELKG